jgi:hypothetical protein
MELGFRFHSTTLIWTQVRCKKYRNLDLFWFLINFLWDNLFPDKKLKLFMTFYIWDKLFSDLL